MLPGQYINIVKLSGTTDSAGKFSGVRTANVDGFGVLQIIHEDRVVAEFHPYGFSGMGYNIAQASFPTIRIIHSAGVVSVAGVATFNILTSGATSYEDKGVWTYIHDSRVAFIKARLWLRINDLETAYARLDIGGLQSEESTDSDAYVEKSLAVDVRSLVVGTRYTIRLQSKVSGSPKIASITEEFIWAEAF